MVKSSLLLASLAAVLGACNSVQPLPPRFFSRVGPAATLPVRRVVALPMSCGSFTMQKIPTADPNVQRWEQKGACPANTEQAVDQIVRSALEFGGYSVIDSEKVNAITATRQEIIRRNTTLVNEVRGATAAAAPTSTPSAEAIPTAEAAVAAAEASPTTSQVKTSEVIGARFSDATPREQDSILAELGAQGFVNVRASIGAGVSFAERRVVSVQLQLVAVPSRQLVWAQRCEVEIAGLLATDEAGLARSAKCAVEGIVAK